MDPIFFFVFLLSVYGIIFFFDRFFKSCMHYPYDAFLNNTGLTINFLQLRWHTTAFNRFFLRWSNSGVRGLVRSFLAKSFTVGVIIALSLLPIGIILLFITIFESGQTAVVNGGGKHATAAAQLDQLSPTKGIKVEILLPGINLPLEEVGFYIATMFFSTVVHELGHALAAVLEDVPVTGFGFQLYFCLPLAYTELSAEHLNNLKWFRKLRILCAGIWNNVLFAGFSYLLLSTMSFMTAPLYVLNQNVIVTEVKHNSPLRTNDERSMQHGNIITYINDCRVNNVDSWYHCLLRSLRSKPGFCVSSDFIRLNDESMEISHHGMDGRLQCCDDTNEKLCCFEYIEDLSNDTPVEIPQHVCLNVRRTLEDAYDYCVAGNCERGFCLRPLLRNSTTIMAFKRNASTASYSSALNTERNKHLRDVLYIGHPADVTRTVRISPFVPKQQYVSPEWGDAYVLFLKYNVVFSFGLAIINAIPCFGLDGYHITNTILNSFLAQRISERPKRDVIALIVTGIGTLLFGLAVLKVLWLSILSKLF